MRAAAGGGGEPSSALRPDRRAKALVGWPPCRCWAGNSWGGRTAHLRPPFWSLLPGGPWRGTAACAWHAGGCSGLPGAPCPVPAARVAGTERQTPPGTPATLPMVAQCGIVIARGGGQPLNLTQPGVKCAPDCSGGLQCRAFTVCTLQRDQTRQQQGQHATTLCAGRVSLPPAAACAPGSQASSKRIQGCL